MSEAHGGLMRPLHWRTKLLNAMHGPRVRRREVEPTETP